MTVKRMMKMMERKRERSFGFDAVLNITHTHTHTHTLAFSNAITDHLFPNTEFSSISENLAATCWMLTLPSLTRST